MSTPRRKPRAKKPTVPAAASKRGPLADDIRQLIEVARQQVAQAVNAGLTVLHWRIGKSNSPRDPGGAARGSWG